MTPDHETSSADDSAEEPTAESEDSGDHVVDGADDASYKQAGILVAAALEVASSLQADRRGQVIIHQREAEYLLRIPQDLLRDITYLARKRVHMRDGHDYMQRGDIDWAWTRLVVGKRNNPWVTIANTIGGLLLGAGIPILITPAATGQALTAGATLLGTATSLVGVCALSIAMTMSFFRR